MKVEDIKILAKAGFTAEQIAALSTINAAPEATTAPDPMQKIIDKVGELENSFKNAMINNVNMPNAQPETAESVLASIINPKGE